MGAHRCVSISAKTVIPSYFQILYILIKVFIMDHDSIAIFE